MRGLIAGLIATILTLQYALWFGHGSWPEVWSTRNQLAQQQQINDSLAQRNAAMGAEVSDLKQGLGAVEERARIELGMVEKNELYFQILDAPPPTTSAVPQANSEQPK